MGKLAEVTDLQTEVRLAQKQSTESFMEWASIREQLHPSLASPSAKKSV